LGWGLPVFSHYFIRGPQRYSPFEGLDDDPEYAVLVLQNVVVPEAKNAPAFTDQQRIPQIMLAWRCVLAAVGFDDQPGFDAGEINKIRRYRKLTAKLEAKLVAPQEIPQTPLSLGWQPAEHSRALCDDAAASHCNSPDGVVPIRA
jgi:hypothetical protein